MNVSLESSALASPSTSVTIGSDTIGGIDYQRVKVVWGTTGTATELTTLAGLPTQLTTSNLDALESVNITSGTVTLTSGTLALGTVTLTSGTVSLGNIGTVATVTSMTSGTVTLTSGTAILGKVSVPVEVSCFSSGTAVTPVNVQVTSSSSFVLLFTGATATQTNRITSAFLSRTSSTEAIYGAQFMTSAAVALSGKIFMSPTPSNTVVLEHNPLGWAQTTTTAVYLQTGVLLSTNISCTLTYIPM